MSKINPDTLTQEKCSLPVINTRLNILKWESEDEDEE